MPISEVYNMDCMEYMKGIPDKFFDLAVVDPPYGIDAAFTPCSRISKYGQTITANDNKPSKEYFDELFRVSNNQIIFGYNHLSDMLPKCKEFIFWYKHQPVVSYADGELAWTSFQKSAKCFDFPYFGNINAEKNRMHPMQKPIKLYSWIFKNYAKSGCKILDTHLGSGSSRIAAYKMGFDFYATEIDKDYFEAQEERFRYECHGEIKTGKGTLVQTSLFGV
jgi:site-specific DNA-methyltransferase (adenine-specific)